MIYPKVTVDHVPIGKQSNGSTKRTGTRLNMDPKRIVLTIHNTANDAKASGERGWLENPNNTRSASWHWCADESQIIEAIPPSEIAYHAGDGNHRSVSLEICERAGAEENAIRWIGELIAMNQTKGITVELTTHNRWTGKNCPRLILPRWMDFVSACHDEAARILKGGEVVNQPKDWEISAVTKAVAEMGLDPAWKSKAGEPATVGLVCEIANRIRTKGMK